MFLDCSSRLQSYTRRGWRTFGSRAGTGPRCYLFLVIKLQGTEGFLINMTASAIADPCVLEHQSWSPYLEHSFTTRDSLLRQCIRRLCRLAGCRYTTRASAKRFGGMPPLWNSHRLGAYSEFSCPPSASARLRLKLLDIASSKTCVSWLNLFYLSTVFDSSELDRFVRVDSPEGTAAATTNGEVSYSLCALLITLSWVAHLFHSCGVEWEIKYSVFRISPDTNPLSRLWKACGKLWIFRQFVLLVCL